MHISSNFKFYVCCFVCISVIEIHAQTEKLPPTNVSFKKVQLLNKYITEGASIADIDADGHPDIIAGVMWWKGPKFNKKFAYAPVKFFPITGPGLEGYATNFFTFPAYTSLPVMILIPCFSAYLAYAAIAFMFYLTITWFTAF